MNIKAFLDTQANYNALDNLNKLANIDHIFKLTDQVLNSPSYEGLAQAELDAILSEINSLIKDKINERKVKYEAILEQTTITIPDIE